MPMMVRIKPFDPQAGHVVRRYTVSAWNTRFEEHRGWYLVPDDWAKYLATLHQQVGNLKSPKLFDVCTVAQAKTLEAEEKAVEAAQLRAEVDAPIPVGGAALAGAMTTADLPTPAAQTPPPAPEPRPAEQKPAPTKPAAEPHKEARPRMRVRRKKS